MIMKVTSKITGSRQLQRLQTTPLGGGERLPQEASPPESGHHGNARVSQLDLAGTDPRSDGQKGLYGSDEAYLPATVLDEGIKTVTGSSGQLMNQTTSQIKKGESVTVLQRLWSGLESLGQGVEDFWKQYGSYVIMAATIGTAFVPGLQVVSLALAAYQIAKGGHEVYDGVRKGQWEEVGEGLLDMASGFTAGVGAIGTKVLGEGFVGAAQMSTKVAKVADRGLTAVEEFAKGHPGRALGALAGALGGGLGLASAGSSGMAEQLESTGKRLLDVSAKLLQVKKAFDRGDFVGGMASVLRGVDPAPVAAVPVAAPVASAVATEPMAPPQPLAPPIPTSAWSAPTQDSPFEATSTFTAPIAGAAFAAPVAD